jgi:hypothetical protein
MPTSPAELLHEWHDFYVLVGTAAATLVGLTFVAASIGASFFNEKNAAALGAFLTPTVTHFGTVLFTSLLVTIPTHGWRSLGGLLGAGGLAGSIYCGRIVLQIVVRREFKVDVSDRLFYALIPVVGYVLLLIAAAFVLERSPAGCNLLAAALLVMLLAGMRNAWDMMLFIAIKAPTPGAPPPPAESPPL